MSTRFYRNPDGRDFAGSLPCQAPGEGDQPFASSPFAHPIPQSRRRASEDLFSASPTNHTVKPGTIPETGNPRNPGCMT
ncbi:MAG TPA: hypothetical protein VHB01_13130 [Nitrosospira sp.]|nr:hypothetical protein [Nitrosospira sp.]